ncbi:MAG: flagellar biosynthetic protein FliR [Gammaproteobacteria bacterium]
MNFTGAEITAWVGSFLWPLFRIGGVIMAAPVFGARTIPVRIRAAFAVLLALMIAPALPPVPVIDVFNPLAILIVVQQVLIGVVMGFTLQIVMSAVITGGQAVALQMGLGFSLMVDPQHGAQVPVLSQFYILMVLLVYLALNGHLVLIEVLVDSFTLLPIGQSLMPESLWQLVRWGSQIFAGGVAIALPAIASLLIINIAFGIMTRAAPQLNIFAIGFPITMTLGFGIVFFTLPSITPHATEMFNTAYQLMKQLLGGTL